jgi:hypothetical protein
VAGIGDGARLFGAARDIRLARGFGTAFVFGAKAGKNTAKIARAGSSVTASMDIMLREAQDVHPGMWQFVAVACKSDMQSKARQASPQSGTHQSNLITEYNSRTHEAHSSNPLPNGLPDIVAARAAITNLTKEAAHANRSSSSWIGCAKLTLTQPPGPDANTHWPINA